MEFYLEHPSKGVWVENERCLRLLAFLSLVSQPQGPDSSLHQLGELVFAEGEQVPLAQPHAGEEAKSIPIEDDSNEGGVAETWEWSWGSSAQMATNVELRFSSFRECSLLHEKASPFQLATSE